MLVCDIHNKEKILRQSDHFWLFLAVFGNFNDLVAKEKMVQNFWNFVSYNVSLLWRWRGRPSHLHGDNIVSKGLKIVRKCAQIVRKCAQTGANGRKWGRKRTQIDGIEIAPPYGQ